jgi:predicted DNA-binding transcriptional regulator AlpA
VKPVNEMLKKYEDLPLTLNVEQLAEVLGISRKVAYRIAKDENLAIRVGEKRLVIPSSRLISYLNTI